MTTYILGAELPNYTVTWRDSAGAVIDFSTGWTFTAKLGIPGDDAIVTKTSGITGAATAPNLTVTWATGELDDIQPGTYVLQISARDGAGKDRPMTDLLTFAAAVA